MCFPGVSTLSKGYRCYDPHTNRTYNTRDVSFLEHVPFFGTSSLVQDSVALQDPSLLPTALVRPIPVFNPSIQLQVYTRRLRYLAPLPPTLESSSVQEPAIGLPEVIPSSTPVPRYPIRVRRPPQWLTLQCSTNHPICKYVSY